MGEVCTLVLFIPHLLLTHTHSQIGLIVGLSVAALMILAVIAIVVAFSIRRWRYHGYNLLDD